MLLHPVLIRERWASPLNSAAAWPTSARAPSTGKIFSRTQRKPVSSTISWKTTIPNQHSTTSKSVTTTFITCSFDFSLQGRSGSERPARFDHSEEKRAMNPRKWIPLLLLATASTLFAIAAASPQAPAWKPLFNGKDLTGWKHVGPGNMTVEDGLIRTHGGMGLLYWTGGK